VGFPRGDTSRSARSDTTRPAVLDTIPPGTLDATPDTSDTTLSDTLDTIPPDTLDTIAPDTSRAAGTEWAPDAPSDTAETPARAALDAGANTARAGSPELFGLWNWADVEGLDAAILYSYANARETDSLYYDAGFTAVSVSDTVEYTYFLPDRWRPRAAQEPVSAELSLDPATRTVTRTRYLGGRPFGAETTFEPSAFTRDRLATSYRQQWVSGSLKNLAIGEEGDRKGGLLDLSLPPMPAALQGIFGSGKSTLSVSGSEKISIGGTSRWFPHRSDGDLSSGSSKFPDLDMKQDLFLKLQGTIGDKVHVDIDQNSNAETSLENRVKIRYEGYDDDVVQRVNLGNTSLSLPATQFVSYGGRHEGLFGISAEGQLGPVKLTTIASKQESEAATRSVPSTTSASTPLREIRARDYVRRTYFFLDDPNRIRSHVNVGAILDTTVLVPALIHAADIKLFKDDQLQTNNIEQNAFEAYVTPSGLPPCGCAPAGTPCDSTFADLTDYDVFNVFELTAGTDYIVHADREDFQFAGTVIELLQPLGDNELLCAAFRTGSAEPLFADVDGDGAAPDVIGSFTDEASCNGQKTYRMIAPPLDRLTGDLLTVGPWARTHALEARNFYRIGGRSISDLDLEIYWDSPTGATLPTNFAGEPYIEITGLDVERLVGTTPQPGQDNEVDTRLLDQDKGLLHFPQLRPFAPDSIDRLFRKNISGVKGIATSGWPAVELTGTDPLVGDFPETEIYDRKATVFRLDSDTHVDRYFMRGEFRSPISEIQLNQFNILEGSEQVTAGTRVLQRGQHYDIDYEFGVVTIKEDAVGPNEEVNVTFSFAPTIGSASRTLLGFSSSLRPEGGNYGLSSTWLYESKGNPERRVRLGEEPTRTVIGELAGEYKAESSTLTDFLGRLPFYTPASRSQLALNGALGVSFPNPNTKGQAYIDDFDASRDARELNLAYRSWKYPAVPQELVSRGLSRDQAAARRGNMVWYSPRRAALRGDLNPELSSEERDDAVRVLEWWLQPNTTTGGETITPEENWFGLTQAVSKTGEDFSTVQFVDVWLNDFNDPGVFENGVLYVDIGEISEDAAWWRTGPPGDSYVPSALNGFEFLDTEDRLTIDGKLDDCNDRDVTCSEDTGLDQAFDGTGSADPSFDDWSVEERDEDEDDPERNLTVFAHINGTEDNDSFDTEDLDADGSLDQRNNYATYRFELASTDTNTVITDVQRDYGDRFSIAPDNGWRLVRLPLGEDFEFDRTGVPDLSLVKHVRVWFDGIGAEKPVQIGSLEFIGNRWLTGGTDAPIRNPAEEPADPAELADGQKFAVSVISNKDNGDVYEEAFELQQSQDRQGDEFEAYLSMDLLNFPEGYSGTCYRRFPQDQDYTRYDTVEYFVQAGRPSIGDMALEFFIRFGDSQGSSYYEYRKKFTPNDNGGSWNLVEVPLARLSSIKRTGVGFVKEQQPDGSWLVVRGSPSLTRVRQISMGVKNVSGGFVRSASVWVNELRLDEVQRTAASASVVKLSTTLSDLGSAAFNWNRQDADFLRVGQDRGSGIGRNTIQSDTRFNLDRFMPRLNMQLPVSFQYGNDRSRPKFQTGSDIRYEGDDATRNERQSISKEFSISYSRTPSRNPLLRYTLDGLNARYTQSAQNVRAPERADTSRSRAASLTYNFTTPAHPLVRLPLGITFDYLPGNLSATTNFSRTRQIAWTRPGSDLDRPLEQLPTISSRQRSLGWNTVYRLFEKPQLSYQWSSTRDLETPGRKIIGVDLGQETQRTENLNAAYTLGPVAPGTLKSPAGEALARVINAVVAPLRPSVNWSGRFSGSRQSDRDVLDDDVVPHSVSNSASTSLSGTLPFTRLVSFVQGIASPKKGAPSDDDEDAPASPGDLDPDGTSPKRGRRPGGGPRGGGGREGQPQEGAPAPSSGGGGPFGLRFSFQDVSARYTVGRASAHTLIDRFPSFAYQLGVSDALDPSIVRFPTNSSTDEDNQSLDFNTGFKVGSIRFGSHRLNSTLDVKVTYTRDATDRVQRTLGIDGAESSPSLVHTARRRWPDLQFSAAGVESGIPALEKRFRRITLTSHYGRSNDVSGDQNEPRRSVRVATEWSPFFSVEATTKGGMQLTLRSNRRTNETTANGTSKNISTSKENDVSFNLRHSIDRKRKISQPFGKGQRIINTRIDLGLSVTLRGQRNSSRSEVSAFKEDVTSDTRTLSVAVNSGYNFTQSISGDATLKYDEATDNKNPSNTSRSLGLTVSASFNF